VRSAQKLLNRVLLPPRSRRKPRSAARSTPTTKVMREALGLESFFQEND
jgi:hypothetical protein